MNTTWVRIRSWHAQVGYVAATREYLTRCGRYVAVPAELSETLSVLEKSCETCLRLVARDQDAG